MPIETPKDLQDHIELAIQVELATIPPYLFAMYSIEDQASEPARLLRSIVAEEMLHAALATNLLLAVGGRPRFDTTDYIPTHPGLLPHHVPPLELRLVPVSPAVIRDVFMRIEQPEVHGAPAEPDVFESLGQFYHALEIAIEELSQRFDVFADTQADCQLSDAAFYAPVAYDAEDSGGLMLIDGAASARAAIEVIVHQGEGLSTDRWADPAHQELTHYYKLLRIFEGTSPLGAVRAVKPDPVTLDFPEALRPVSDLFNAVYRSLFLLLDELFGPSADKTAGVERLYRLMAGVLSRLALFLVRQPIGDGRFAGPTFEIYEFTSDVGAELAGLASTAAARYPDLLPLADDLQQLR